MKRSPYGSPGSAVLSPCGRYRYRLAREWPRESLGVVWIMLNPSTATGEYDDATITRCIGFSREWGFARMDVLNLFALRATDPGQLKLADDPVGPGNDDAIRQVCKDAEVIVCAWGSNAQGSGRDQAVIELLADQDHFLKGRVHCLGLNRDRTPRHPLYLPGTTKPEVWYPR